MKNPATQPSNKLNAFTSKFAKMTEGSEPWVKLRDGTLVRPVYKSAEDDTCEDMFFFKKDGGQMYCWNLDGTSVTRPAYDMMEIF